MDDLLWSIIGPFLGMMAIGGVVGFLITLPKAMDYKARYKKEPTWQLAREAFEHYRKSAIILAVIVLAFLFLFSIFEEGV